MAAAAAAAAGKHTLQSPSALSTCYAWTVPRQGCTSHVSRACGIYCSCCLQSQLAATSAMHTMLCGLLLATPYRSCLASHITHVPSHLMNCQRLSAAGSWKVQISRPTCSVASEAAVAYAETIWRANSVQSPGSELRAQTAAAVAGAGGITGLDAQCLRQLHTAAEVNYGPQYRAAFATALHY
jgi:hypothetical protein